MTFGSLFAGIGGLDLGLERAGFECRWQVENDPFCQKILARHWPEVKRYGDIRTIRGTDLAPVDLICGGFPCQDLSNAGKRAGIEADRSGLWFEFARLVHELRPRYVLAENVPGLLVRGAMDRVIGELARLGYVGCWRSLRAADFGASHLRKRVFIVAYSAKPGLGISGVKVERDSLPDECCNNVAYRSGFRRSEGWPESARSQGRFNATERYGAVADSAHELHNGSRNAGAGRRGESADDGSLLAHGFSPRLEERRRIRGDDAEKRAPAERDCGTLPAFAPGPADPRWPVILAARPDLAPALESPVCRVAPRLPSDLDGAMQDRTKRLGRLGNAVVPQIAEWIGLRIIQAERGGL